MGEATKLKHVKCFTVTLQPNKNVYIADLAVSKLHRQALRTEDEDRKGESRGQDAENKRDYGT